MSFTRAVAASALAIAVGLAVSPTAGATFPGRGGELLYSGLDYSSKGGDLYSWVSAFDPIAKSFGSLPDLGTCVWGLGDGACFAGQAVSSADGERIAVVMTRRAPGDPECAGSDDADCPRSLELVAPDGQQTDSLSLEAPASDPAWSPDGETLLVTQQINDAMPQVAIMSVDGGKAVPILPEGSSDADWSVAGDIAYVQNGDIWVTRLGEVPRRLTTGGGSAPSWSPDGRHLAFVFDDRIRIVAADGSGERQLSDLPAESPSWSPDGRHIAFVRNRPPGQLSAPAGIWVVAVDGSCPQQVSREGPYSYNRSPSWRPVHEAVPRRLRRGRCLIAPPFVDFTSGGGLIRVSRSDRLRVRFRATPRARGRIVLRTRRKVRAWSRTGMRRQHLTLARRRFTVGTGGVVRIRLRLRYEYGSILRRYRRLPLRAVVAIRDPVGQKRTVRRPLMLFAPRVRLR